MAWVTERIITGEIGNDAEYANNTIYSWTFGPGSSLADVHTGDNALSSLGPATGIGCSPVMTHTTMRIGFWFKCKGWWTSSAIVWLSSWNDTLDKYPYRIVCSDPDTTYIQYYRISDGSYQNVASVDSAKLIHGYMGEWHHIGMFVNYSTGTIALYDNGRYYMGVSGLTLQRPQHVYVAQQGIVGGQTYIDNLYFDFSAASELLACPPAKRYYYALPDGAGTYSQWTPTAGANYENVDDDPIPPDDDSSIVWTDTNNLVDTYTFSAISGLAPMTTISGALVQVYVRMYGEDGFGRLSTLAKIGGNELESDVRWVRPERLPSQDSDDKWWTVITGWFDDKPGGGEWTLADFNSAEFGFKSGGLV